MNCREAERLLDTFFDGELDGRLMRDAALHITRCQSCERELQEKEGVKTLLADTIEDTIGSADLSGIWAGVEAGIQSGGQDEKFSQNGQMAAQAVQAELAADSRDEEAPRRHAFGRRAGGRHGGAAGRGARRGVGRVSAAGMGAVAVGLAAFLVFNVGPEQDGEPLLADPVMDLDPAVAGNAGADTKLAADAAPEPAAVKRVLASTAPKTESAVEQVALVQNQPGPVASEEPLSSPWPQQQVQAGPLDFATNHAMSLWRPAASR